MSPRDSESDNEESDHDEASTATGSKRDLGVTSTGRALVATSVTRKARPLSPSRLAHMLAKLDKSQYKMKSKEELMHDKIEALFVQKRVEMLHSRVSTQRDLPEAMKSAIQGDAAALRRELCIGYAPRINERSKVSGHTVLHEASAGGHFACVKLLCYEHRETLDVDRATMIGASSALHLAVANDHRAVAALLLTMGATVNQRDRDGCTPLHLVRSLSLLKLLLKTNVDVILRNNAGRTAYEEYQHRTPAAAQEKDVLDILRQKEMTRAIQVTRSVAERDEERRQRELDKLALVNQNESQASRIGRNNAANQRVVLKGEEEIRKQKEKLQAQRQREREKEQRKENLLRAQEYEKTLHPLQAKAALLARLTKHTRTHKKKKHKDENEDSEESDSHSDVSDGDGAPQHMERGMRVVSAKQLKRELLNPPVRQITINQRFLDGKKLSKS